MKKRILAYVLSVAMIIGVGVLPTYAKETGGTEVLNQKVAEEVTLSFDTTGGVTLPAITVPLGEAVGELPDVG